MRRKLAHAIVGAALVVALACSSAPKPSTEPEYAPPPSADGASLESSFRIPQGAGVSHMPSVVFTADGKRMLTATSEHEVAIFEVASKKLLRRVKLPEPGTDGIAIDAAGRYVAWVLRTGGVAVMELVTEKLVARNGALQARWLALSPDAKLVAIAHASLVEVRDVATLAFVRALPERGSEVTSLAWSADGTMIASTRQDGRLAVHAGERSVYETKKAQALYAVAFHPSGGAVAYGGHDKQVFQYDFAAETEEVISKGQPYWITALGYSPDGTMLAVGDESCDIWLYRVKSKELTFHNKHHNECWLSAVAWAPDNETFLFGCRPNAHAGKPTLHAPLARAEAARTAASRASRAKLLAAVDALIAKETDANKRDALAAYRKGIEAEELPRGAASTLSNQAGIAVQYMWTEGNAGPLTATSTGITWSGGAQTVRGAQGSAPAEIQTIAQEHEKVVQQEMTNLAQDYCVNSWKAKR